MANSSGMPSRDSSTATFCRRPSGSAPATCRYEPTAPARTRSSSASSRREFSDLLRPPARCTSWPSFSSSDIFFSRTSGRDAVCPVAWPAQDKKTTARQATPAWRMKPDNCALRFCCWPNLPESYGQIPRKRVLLLMIHAVAHWLHRHRVPLLPVLLTLFNRVVFAVQLPAATQLGRGVRLNYSGLGTVLHPRAVIGARVEIGPGVVIGGRSEIWEVPVIEDDVHIGVGAKVLGPVRVGRGAIIGANAVVLRDVPPGAVVGGIPAKILRMRDPAALPGEAEDPLGDTGT